MLIAEKAFCPIGRLRCRSFHRFETFLGHEDYCAGLFLASRNRQIWRHGVLTLKSQTADG